MLSSKPNGSAVETSRRTSRRRRRSRDEWQRRYTETQRELDEIHLTFAEKMEKIRGASTGALYIRYSTRYQDSAAAQCRELLKLALEKKVFVPRETIFVDLGLRGSNNSREGLAEAEAALATGRAKVLLVFATNRLHRRMSAALSFMDRVTKEPRRPVAPTLEWQRTGGTTNWHGPPRSLAPS